MEMLLKEYMSYDKALNTIAESSYDVLSLEDNICYSQVRFYDGYAVTAKDFEKWSFVKRGDERYILDENGLSYHRISKNKSMSRSVRISMISCGMSIPSPLLVRVSG